MISQPLNPTTIVRIDVNDLDGCEILSCNLVAPVGNRVILEKHVLVLGE